MDDVITNNFGNASVLDLNNSNGITLDEPDLQQMREDRLERTRALMKTVDPGVTATILPQHTNNATLEDSAAICIQAHFRGHLGRKLYCEQLYHQFEQEEIAREKKTEGQMEEGELLIENHRLQVQFDDNSTTRRNKERRYITKVITIQRAWRTYQRHKHLASGATTRSSADQSPQPSDPDDVSDSSSIDHPMSLSEGSDGELLPQVKSCVGAVAKHVIIEAEAESMASDYSEMADFVKEHLANVHIICKDDLATGNTQFPADRFTIEQKVPRFPGETDDEYSKRLRKLNYLSLAQEFAELKKVDAGALPFDLRCDRMLTDFNPTSDGSSELDTDLLSTVATPMSGLADIKMAPPGVPTVAWTEVTPADGGQDVNRSDTDTNVLLSDKPAADGQSANHHQGCGPGYCDNTADKSSSVGASDSNRSQSAPARQHAGSMSQDCPEPDEESESVDGGIASAPGGGASAPGGGAMEFDVYNIETTLPEMDWARLEQQLELAAVEESKRKSRRNDREEIRRKLAMGFDEDYYGGERVIKKPSLQTRLLGGMNLQICFVNEAALTDQNEAGGASLDAPQVAPAQAREPSPPSGAMAPPVATVHSAARSEKKKKKKKEALEEEDLVTRQARLQAEATMALAQVRPMAHMQLEVEKQLRKKSPIAEIVGIPGVGDGTKVRFSCQRLEQMHVARLQVILNDLHTQIENLNEELVQMLVERDDLHMEQDSKLVDIEDLTRRAQELTSKVNTHSSREKKKPKQKK